VPYFAVTRERGESWDAPLPMRMQARWDDHAAFMDALAEEGFIVLGGPVGEEEEGFMFLVDAESEQEIVARLAEDPWVPTGQLRLVSIEPWEIQLGNPLAWRDPGARSRLVRRPFDRRWLLVGLVGSWLATLAALVSVGALTGLDQWSLDHLMPGLSPTGGKVPLLDSLFPIFDPGKQHGHEAISAGAYAVVWLASAVPSVVLVGAAMGWLGSRGQCRLALRLGLAFVLVNVVELIGKTVIARDALFATAHGEPVHVQAFDSSFPSGHMSRAIVLAACLIACVPRARSAALVWTVAVLVLLVVGGWHTPSDVAGGLALGFTTSLVATRFLPAPRSAS
jgi:membrane-associated phospholipid phosphatase/uncharacterized protein YciI